MDEYIKREEVLSRIYATHSTGGFANEEAYLWLHDEITNLSAADVQPVNGWISVKDRLPEPDTDVLVCAKSKNIRTTVIVITRMVSYIWCGHAIETEPYWRDPYQYFHNNYDITHWMPLPQPPKEADQGE